MHNCEFCGKGFSFPSKLLRHLSKKIPCYTNKVSIESVEIYKKDYKEEKKVYENKKKTHKEDEKVYSDDKKVNNSKKLLKCERCEKVLKTKQGMKYHSKICKGVHILQCPTCLKSFADRRSKSHHIKNVKCSPPEEKVKVDVQEEIQSLRKEVAILKATTRGNTTNTTNNINNITNNYIIKYDPDTRCITSNDPNAPVPELLCLNGFKHEAAKSKLKDIDRDTLQKHIDNVRLTDNYYALYTFFFRNVDNQRLQMFNMGKSSNSTHAHVFNNG